MKYTQGKWEVTHFEGKTQVFCNRRCIAGNLYDEENEPTLGELKSNANLISAAPDMYEACLAARRTFEAFRIKESDPRYIKLEQAITKAEANQ